VVSTKKRAGTQSWGGKEGFVCKHQKAKLPKKLKESKKTVKKNQGSQADAKMRKECTGANQPAGPKLQGKVT